MKSILCGIVAIMCASLIAWAIAPWFLLLWLSRNYNLHIEVSPKDANIPAKPVEVEFELEVEETGEESEVYNLELEDHWKDDEPVMQADSEPVVQEIERNVETVKKEIETETGTVLVFPECPKNLHEMTLRGLQLLCGDINKVKRGSIAGYRNQKDKQEVIGKLEAFYQSI